MKMDILPTRRQEPDGPNETDVNRLANRIIGIEIYSRRRQKKIAQETLARVLGISKAMVRDIERQGYGLFPDRIAAILGYLEISLEDLIGCSTLEELRERVAADYQAYLNDYHERFYQLPRHSKIRAKNGL